MTSSVWEAVATPSGPGPSYPRLLRYLRAPDRDHFHSGALHRLKRLGSIGQVVQASTGIMGEQHHASAVAYFNRAERSLFAWPLRARSSLSEVLAKGAGLPSASGAALRARKSRNHKRYPSP